MKKHIIFLFLGINFSSQAMLKNFKTIEIGQSPCEEAVFAYIPSEHVGALSKSLGSYKSIFIVPDAYANQESSDLTERFLNLLYAIPREKWNRVGSKEVVVYDFRPFCELLDKNLVCSSCQEQEMKRNDKTESKIDPNNIDLIVRTTPNNAAAILAAYGLGCGLIGFGLGGTFAFLMNKGKGS